MIQKLGARGIKLSERSWDDGSDHDDVTKIFVQGSRQGIASLYINYVKNGKPKDGSIHGFFDYGLTQTFEINHLQNEHLESVDAYYHIKSYDLKAIQFKTNFRTSELMGYTYECTMFTLAVKGKKIIGFHGSDRVQIFSLGAYFTSITPTRLEAKGGMGGKKWDDGFDHEIRGRDIHRPRRDYIAEIQTSKGRISPTYGNLSNGSHTKLVLENNGCALVGFYGLSYGLLSNLGAYFSPTPPTPAGEKLEALGGSDIGGASWEDGNNFDGVRKIYIGKGEVSIVFVKFMYSKDNRVVLGADHGTNTLHGVEEFELDYPSEYITTVEGNYDIVHGSDDLNVILMLRFKTNKRTSPAFGFGKISSFVHHKQGYKIVGFHGISGNMLQQIGVHVLPITDEGASTSN
ncbi:LOW QUALITY PROTEIN: jacalin-related lectin 47 [Capsella rubella]|uniref:LOW QUALITY PROTEIN: jacalin-related lectin 47 n=1 Tax=Capsella rubella TaxID=81985 RepID=UPI000CD4AC13|nr:LOW QUALITY PROTEIN: jacalin-related lectin 47 [Capsella rubella]